MRHTSLITRSTALRSPGDVSSHRSSPIRSVAIGNQASLRALNSYPPAPPFIQRKLKVGAVDDPLEHEADRVAEHVTRMPDQAPAIPAITPADSRLRGKCACGGTCDHCKGGSETHATLRRMQATADVADDVLAPPIVNAALGASGAPLDRGTRAYFEPRFGVDLADVRVHSDGMAAESAKAVSARAYTVGNHVVFGASQFAPATEAGSRLLAHELTHVLQGSAGVLRRNVVPSQLTQQRLSDAALVARANELFERAATEKLQEKGREATPERLGAMRGQVTVGVLQGYKNGKLVTLVNGNDPKWEPYIRRAMQASESYVEGTSVVPYKVRSDELRKSGHINVHSEQTLAAEATSEGLVQSRVATSNAACSGLCMSNLQENYPDVVHVNPNRTYLREHPEHVIPPQEPPPQTKPAAKPPPIPGTGPKVAQESADVPAGAKETDTGEGGRAAEPASGSKAEVSTIEYVGDPVEEVDEASLQPHAMMEGFLVMLAAKQFENLQKDEVQKYEDKLRDLSGRIDALRNEGKDVGVTLIVERPNTLNLGHGFAPDPGNLIYFKDLRIDDNPWWANADPNYNAQAREAARGGTLEQQLNAQMGVKYPMDKPPPKGWHYQTATQVLPSYRKLASLKGFDGAYRPVQVMGMLHGKYEAAKDVGLSRVLQIWHQTQYAYSFEMRESVGKVTPPQPSGQQPPPSSMSAVTPEDEPVRGSSDPRIYQPQLVSLVTVSQDENKLGGVLIKGEPGHPGSYKLDSQMWHTREKGKDVIYEVVTGEDLDPQWRFSELSKWSALIRWEKL